MTSGAAGSDTPALRADLLPDLSTLRLSVKQVPSATDVTFEVALINSGRDSVQTTTNPLFMDRTMAPIGDRGRDAEVEFRLEDAQGRLVPVQCLFGPRNGYRADKSLLAPGQTQTFSFSLLHRCYSLVPGERLSLSASYANLPGDETQPAIGLPVVRAPDPISVVVPLGWPEDDATKYGYASDRPTRSR
jgi:hypothetical protein